MRQLFELCGADPDVRFSPYVWRARLALVHKGLGFESVGIQFLEKDPLETAGSKTVPVLHDEGKWIKDSFAIAVYLDETYPESPLFGGDIAAQQARLLNEWINRTLVLGMFPMIAHDVSKVLDAKNSAYFVETREQFLGRSLAEVQSERDERLPKFHKSLAPLKSVLEKSPYIAGDAPAWADIAVFGTLLWPYFVTDFDPIPAGSSIAEWRNRMFADFESEIARAKRGI